MQQEKYIYSISASRIFSFGNYRVTCTFSNFHFSSRTMHHSQNIFPSPRGNGKIFNAPNGKTHLTTFSTVFQFPQIATRSYKFARKNRVMFFLRYNRSGRAQRKSSHAADDSDAAKICRVLPPKNSAPITILERARKRGHYSAMCTDTMVEPASKNIACSSSFSNLCERDYERER